MSNILLLGAGGPKGSGPALWTPNDEAGLLGWYDLSDYSYYDGTTKEWTRRWGTLPKQTAVSSGPTKSTTGFSGNKNCLVFDGSSDTGLTMASPGFTDVVTAFALNITEAKSTVNPVLWNRSTLSINQSGVQFYETYGIACAYGNGTKAEDYAQSLPSQLLLVTRHAADSRIIRTNGAQIAANTTNDGSTPPSSTDSFRLVRYIGSSTDWTVEIAAVGIFTSASWSTGLAEKIEGYIAHNNLGNTTSILPGGHTYKSSPP